MSIPFSDGSKAVMNFAQQEASAGQCQYVGTEHVLAGLVLEGTGIAAQTLQGFGVTVDRIRAEVKNLPEHPGTPDPFAPRGKLPHHPETRQIIGLAINKAQSRGRMIIPTEFLLLGMLDVEHCTGSQLIRAMRLNPIDLVSVAKFRSGKHVAVSLPETIQPVVQLRIDEHVRRVLFYGTHAPEHRGLREMLEQWLEVPPGQTIQSIDIVMGPKQ